MLRAVGARRRVFDAADERAARAYGDFVEAIANVAGSRVGDVGRCVKNKIFPGYGQTIWWI